VTCVAIVSGLFTYPLKSGMAKSHSSVDLSCDGLVGDRTWMVVDTTGKQITAREAPKLLSVGAEILNNGALCLSAANCAPLIICEASVYASASLFSDPLQVLDAGDAAANWLSDLLGRTARLVQRSSATRRDYDNDDYSRFGDLAPVLIVNRSSLDDLNNRINWPLDQNRFRPNIVLDNVPAFDEDNWQEIRIGDAVLKVVEPCVRCVMTTIDPATERRDLSQQPLRALADYRATETGDIHFGVYAQVKNAGEIRTGDEVNMTARAASRSYSVAGLPGLPDADHRILRVRKTECAADNARHLWLDFEDGQPTDIQPGQFVSLRLPQQDGTHLIRCYTISAQREEGRSIRLSVRYQRSGGASEYLVRHAQAGDTIWATGVHGEFVMKGSPDPALFISGGSGVTPFVAYLPTLDDQCDIYHIHSDKSQDHTIGFAELVSSHQGLPGYHLLTQWTGTQGRLSASRFTEIPDLKARNIWICGPEAFVSSMESMLQSHRIPAHRIQFETFAAPQAGQATGTIHTVTLDDGPPIPVDAGVPLLVALRASGETLESSCEIGTCQTCKLRLLEGTCHPPQQADLNGYVLACTSFARSDLRLERQSFGKKE
jgi:MOSC domain-containing protein